MRLTRILVVLLLLMTALTPSLAAACTSASSAHDAMASMVDHDGAALEMPCDHPEPAQDHSPPSDRSACQAAAICHLASGGARVDSLPAIASRPATHPLPPSPFALASVDLPPPIEPPIA